ncbi:hypothetical protein LUU34_01483000 [Aix galericulata]|nr:hypothetical protein LUU34_01483000 [Aix galericulata]
MSSPKPWLLAPSSPQPLFLFLGICTKQIAWEEHSSEERELNFGRAPQLEASASGVAEPLLRLREGRVFVLPPFSFISPLVLPVPLANSLEFLKCQSDKETNTFLLGHKLVVEQLDILRLLLPHGLEVGVDIKVHGSQEPPVDGELLTLTASQSPLLPTLCHQHLSGMKAKKSPSRAHTFPQLSSGRVVVLHAL